METDMTREEAIEALKEKLDYYARDKRLKAACETLIPELRESEDEKMLKRIRLCLDECVHSDIIRDYERDECVAYLEKQKEQKPVHTAKEAWKEMRLEVYAQASGNRHEPNYSNDSTKMFSLCDIDEIFEKIGNSTIGSQPAEWSEEDDAFRDLLICILKNEHPNGIFSMSAKHISALKCDVMPVYRIIAWLKSLRPQPHWKPSEEQMSDLWRAATMNTITCPTLKSLYEDLKKL